MSAEIRTDGLSLVIPTSPRPYHARMNTPLTDNHRTEPRREIRRGAGPVFRAADTPLPAFRYPECTA